MQPVKVECRNIALAYGSTRVLHDVSLTIEPGEFFALLGPSGSGKSTLLRMIAGFSFAQAGEVLVDGRDLSRTPPWQRNIGMVFQNYALWPHMTVEKNVAFGLEERRMPRAQIDAKVQEMLRLVGLTEYAKRRPGQLSGGQQQRVALARTLAIEPKILLLDEPLSNLDARLRVQMRQELRSLQRRLGITTIFVTHDQEEALTTCDRIAVMDKGVIQQVGTPMDLYDRPVNRFVANFVGTVNLVAGEITGGDEAGVEFVSATLGTLRLAVDARTQRRGRAELALRPHSLRLAATGAAPPGNGSTIPGRVLESEFLGEFIRYRISVASAEWIADQPHHADTPAFAVGSPVAVTVDPRNARLLPD